MTTRNMIFIAIIVAVVVFLFMTQYATAPQESEVKTDDAIVSVVPVEHASFVLAWDDTLIFNDPVGEATRYTAYGTPNIVFLTDIHQDHLDIDTLSGVVADNTVIIAPAAVYDELPEDLKSYVIVMSNGDIHELTKMSITAVPMYNLPESETAYHPKGRGNGYLLQLGKTRVYIAGDTADTPEMRAMKDIDIAFVPMNLPYTMDVKTAAAGVLAFAPKVVYPYHYRGQSGLSNVQEFADLIKAGNPDIEVKLLDWYKSEVDVTE